MGSNNHRGEISQIGDDIFINYALSLPVNEGPASTSGYFWKNPPGIYSYFIVAAVDPGGEQQVTQVWNKDKTIELDKLEWSNQTTERVNLGLITGYNPPSKLPNGWMEIPLPDLLPVDWEKYYPVYISMASASKPGMDKDGSSGKMELHLNRLTSLDSAILTIALPILPADVSFSALKPFLYRHKHAHGGAAPATPQPEEITNTVQLLPNQIVIGAPGEVLQMGLYVVAMPALETATANSTSPVQTPYHHEEASETVVAV